MKIVQSIASRINCRHAWLATLSIIFIIYLFSIDWTLADRVIREFESARDRDTIRTQVFGGKMNWIVSANQAITELLPIGTPQETVLSALGDSFGFADFTTSRPDLYDGFKTAYGDFDALLCGSYKKGKLFSDTYSLCLLFNNGLLIGLDAKVVFKYL